MLFYYKNESTAARRRLPLHLVDATDGITPRTAEAGGQPQISFSGGTFASTVNTLTAVGSGLYYVALDTTELNNLGPAVVRYKSANTAEFQVAFEVVLFDPYDANLGMPSAIDVRVIMNSLRGQSELYVELMRKIDAIKPGEYPKKTLETMLKQLDDLGKRPNAPDLEAIKKSLRVTIMSAPVPTPIVNIPETVIPDYTKSLQGIMTQITTLTPKEPKDWTPEISTLHTSMKTMQDTISAGLTAILNEVKQVPKATKDYTAELKELGGQLKQAETSLQSRIASAARPADVAREIEKFRVVLRDIQAEVVAAVHAHEGFEKLLDRFAAIKRDQQAVSIMSSLGIG